MKINPEKHNLQKEDIDKLVKYDPITGEMRRILKIHPKSGKYYPCDDLVTGSNNRGYKWLKMKGHMYLVHRLAFVIMTGNHPNGEVDHIDGNRQNNKWENLRDCSPLAQSRNQGLRKDNTSGVRGVNYNNCKTNRSAKRWVARISHNGERILLGNFHTFAEAVAVRKQAEIDYGYHENHGKRQSWEK